ncbi:hypothetical protein [Psychrobacter sp. I-STPA6b]|uniref:hypothetical protein n=1 Tax=Psychrobacter sp. I-STPA6b TaxID=2585718 RepID=UPI001D0CCD14|nr:hypothetical protein [Psychrobacter sp. I-STPA6b]
MRNRVSVTHLDSYQYFLDSDMTEQELYDRLFGAYTPTPAMSAGTAWHKILENYLRNPSGIYQQDSFTFDISKLNDTDEVQVVNLGKPWEREQKHVVQLIDGVDLVGKIDVETPYAVIDHKLTGSYNPERYLNAWQWRAYLAMRGKNRFIYQVFECKPVTKYGQVVEIKDYHTLDMYAYDGMIDDVKDCLNDLNNLINKWRSEGLSCKRVYK